MKTLTAILFAAMLAFSGASFAKGDDLEAGKFPFPSSYNPDNESVNCEDACFFHPAFGFYPADDGDTTNDDVNAEK
jgi:hypothetical protein